MELLQQIPVLLNKSLVSREVDGELLILDQNNNCIHKLNHTAAVIWSFCDGKTTIGDIISIIEHDCSENRSTITTDVLSMFDELKKLQLIELKN